MAAARNFGSLALLLLLAGCPLYVTAYEHINKTEQVRYRISVYIDTPDGEKIGNGVWGRTFSPKLDPVFGFLGSGFTYSSRTQGDAILIDVGHGRHVYALVGGILAPRKKDEEPVFNSGVVNNLPEYAYFKYGYKAPILPPAQLSDRNKARYKISALKQLSEIEVNLDCWSMLQPYCPFLIRMDNPANPSSIKPIDPNSMENSLGPGYRLKKVTLEITDEAVTRGISKTIPWLQNQDRDGSSACTGNDSITCVGFTRNEQ